MSKDSLDALLGTTTRQVGNHLVIIDQGKLHLRINQRYAMIFGDDIAQFRLVGLEKTTTRGYIIEKVLDTYVRANRALRKLLIDDSRTLYLKTCTHLVFRSAGIYFDVRHSANTSQGFATKAHRTELEEVGCLTNLGSGMAFEGHTHIGRAHALAIINHLQQFASAVEHHDTDMRSPRI